LKRLPASAAEEKYIIAIFKEENVTSFIRRDATKSKLFSDKARNAKVLHIATHGYYDPLTPYLVGLFTTREGEDKTGFLSLSQLVGKRYSSNLVVISGCETSLGVSYNGEVLHGLSAGFLAQGAESVMSTLWSIPDKPTSKLMENFYTELAKWKGNAPKALHYARKKFIDGGRYSHPYYWAAFSMTSANRHIEQAVFNH